MRTIAILMVLCATSAGSAQVDEPASAEFLRSYGFVLSEPNLTCAKGGQSGMIKDSRPGVTWYTLCESGMKTPSYVGVKNFKEVTK